LDRRFAPGREVVFEAEGGLPERPEDRDHGDGDEPEQQVQRQPGAREVEEAVAAGAVDPHVRLVADRRGKGGGGGDRDGRYYTNPYGSPATGAPSSGSASDHPEGSRDFYRELLAYREAPSPAEADRLEAAFDTLFGTQCLWVDLKTCIERTRANQEKLLRSRPVRVLAHPELPLHNNPAELTARRRARKRDVSFGPRSETGLRAWGTFQGPVETPRKLGIRFWDYLRDRLTQGAEMPPLPEVIATRAADPPLGASWAAA
jgi:hypothetical protein